MQAFTPTEILQKVHVRYEGNIDYPTSGEEDYILRLAYMDDAINILEQEALENIKFDFLLSEASITATGTGIDDLPTDFLSFLTDYIKVGNQEYTRINKYDGNLKSQSGLAPYVFWKEGTKIKSLPAFSGTVTFPYQRKFTRFPLGTESDTLEGEGSFYVEQILSMLFLLDGDLNQYNIHANNAKEIFDKMKVEAITNEPNQDTFGIGM